MCPKRDGWREGYSDGRRRAARTMDGMGSITGDGMARMIGKRELRAETADNTRQDTKRGDSIGWREFWVSRGKVWIGRVQQPGQDG